MGIDVIKTIHKKIFEHMKTVVVGKEDVIELAIISLLCNGHMLIDDVPGTGKTVFAKTFAQSLALDFKRIQCVPDMLPSDLTGVNFFDMKESEFRFIPGPVFTNILLVDEINRAMPKTQSGLLECMEERQVTVDGVTYTLNSPFMVMATQNPIESKGTFDLPEAQLDRFLIKVSMGYPTIKENVEILSRKLNMDVIFNDKAELVNIGEIKKARSELDSVYIHSDLLNYIVSICEATRKEKNVVLGASPRAMISLAYVARGYAAIGGRNYVLPDDIKRASMPVLSHRIMFQDNFFTREDLGAKLVSSILDIIPVPSENIDFSLR